MAMLAIPAAAELGTLIGPEAAALLAEMGGSSMIANVANNLVSGKLLKMGKKSAREILEDVTTKAGREKLLDGVSKIGRRGGKYAMVGADLLHKTGLIGSRKTKKYKKMIGAGTHHFQSALGKLKRINKFF